jgi:hypothetical protein
MTPLLPIVYPGDIVEIDFLDHMETDGDGDPGENGLDFKIVGRLIQENPASYSVETWCYRDRAAPRDSNVVFYTIIKGAIQRMEVLKRVPGADSSSVA